MTTEAQDSPQSNVDTRRLLDHLQVGLLMYTGSGHIIEMNRYARLMLKRDEAVSGLLLDEVLPEEIVTDLPNLASRMKKALNGSAKKTVILPSDEAPVYWEITLSRSAAAGDSDVTVLVLDDVTELVEFEQLQKRAERLERMNMAAREANRLKTEFLANMSHELRTPLNSIIGFAELMASGKVGEPSEQHKEFLHDILTSGRHLLQLINDVLDLSKVEAGHMEFSPEPVDMGDLLDEVTSILRELAAKRRIAITQHIEEDARTPALDPLRTKQILYNYISNAVKFTQEGDTIQVRVSQRDQKIHIEVIDNGPGIESDDLERLFHEFEQLDQTSGKSVQGTGLGLALTKRLVDAQGGAVGVESAPGEGSRFWVSLPQGAAAKEAAGRAADAARETRDPIDPASTVLVVEDDPEQQRHITTALRAAGFEVDPAATAREAVAKVRENRYDAITLDLLLPDGHGEDVLRALRSKGDHRGTPVIVASVVEPSGAVFGFPVVDFLVKPFDAADLVSALERAGVAADRPILVVDDDPAVQRLVTHHLKSMGHRVFSAGDGREALEVAAVHPPGMVVLDLLMPGMDGFQFVEAFRRTRVGARVPIIVWTNKELSRDERAFLQRAAHQVLQKGEGGTHTLAVALRNALAPSRDAAPTEMEVQR